MPARSTTAFPWGFRCHPAWLLLVPLLLAASPARAESAAPGPPPDVNTLLQRLLDRSEQSAQMRADFRSRHTHTTRRVRQEFNSKGEPRNHSDDTTRHPANGTLDSKGTSEPRHGANQENEFTLSRSVLDRFDFTLAARETIGTNTLCRLNFIPRPGNLPSHKMVDRFINRMAGTLWIRETDGTLVRAQLHLLDKVSFVGGLVGACYEFQCLLERAATPDGLWYTRDAHWTVDYREFFVHKRVQATESIRLEDAAPSP